MKIALFGGSFNPVHNEHLNIVKAAKRELGLDKIIVIPSNITPNKNGRITASGADRLNMCRLSFEGIEGVEVSDCELNSGGVSYSYLTCREFAKRYKDAERYFLMGADMLENFRFWKNPEDIIKNVTLAVCSREVPLEKTDYGAVKFSYVGAKVSSTKIRTLAALNEDITAYVPKKEADYIESNRIYSIGNIDRVKQMLTPERWQHTVRVALCATANCFRFGLDERAALMAAAFHDCAKYLPLDSPLLEEFTCPRDVPEPVIHQYSGAYVAEHVFGIENKEVINAIKYHTSGREDMTDLEKLIFLSDMLEDGRSFEGVEKLREEFSHSLDGAMLAALEHQLNYLNASGNQIYSLTQKAYNYLKEKSNEQSGKN